MMNIMPNWHHLRTTRRTIPKLLILIPLEMMNLAVMIFAEFILCLSHAFLEVLDIVPGEGITVDGREQTMLTFLLGSNSSFSILLSISLNETRCNISTPAVSDCLDLCFRLNPMRCNIRTRKLNTIRLVRPM